MNILITNDQPMNPFYGGIEWVTDILAKALLKEGHNVYYFAMRTPSAAIMDYAFPAEMHILPNAIVDTPQNEDVYKRFLKEKKIELIINQRGLLPEADFFIRNLPDDIRVISVLHSKPFGFWDAYWHTLFANRYGFSNVCKCIIKALAVPYLVCFGKRRAYEQTKRHLEWVSQHSDKMVVLSQEYKDILCQRCSIEEPNVIVIPNPNTFTQVKEGNKNNEVIYVGRLAAWDKNVMDVISIWAMVEPLHPDWQLTLVGEGPQAIYIQRRIRRLGLKRVQLVGKQDPQLYYERARLSVLVSNYEGFPMSVTESMQHGVVPVVMNTFCAHDIIQDGQTGCIVKAHDKKAFAQALSQLMSNPDQLRHIAQQAKQAVQQYNQSNIINQWFQLLSQYTM